MKRVKNEINLAEYSINNKYFKKNTIFMSKLRSIIAIFQEAIGANSRYLELSRDHVGDIEKTVLN